MLIFIISSVVVVIIAVVLRLISGHLKRKEQDKLNHLINMSMDDYERLVGVIKRCRTQYDLESMDYEIDQWYSVYAELIPTCKLKRMYQGLQDHIMIRRLFVRN